MGDWNDDLARGRREHGWSNQPGAEAYNQGAAQAQRDRLNAFFDEQRRAREQVQRQRAATGFPTPGTTTPRTPGGPLHKGRPTWHPSFPIPLRVLLAAQPELVTPVPLLVQRFVTHQHLDHAGLNPDEGHGGAVTLIQRFGSAASLKVQPQYPRYASD